MNSFIKREEAEGYVAAMTDEERVALMTQVKRVALMTQVIGEVFILQMANKDDKESVLKMAECFILIAVLSDY